MYRLKKNMTSFVEKTFCISLDRHPDRWEQFQARLPKDWPFPAAERFSAIDGEVSNPEPWWSVGKAAWGCYQSHLQIIEHCLAEGIESCLILEDDAICCEAFSQLATTFMNSLPSDWQMVYLGGQHLATKEHPPVRVNANVYIPYDVNRTHAYAIRGRSAMMRLRRHLTNHDSWQSGHHIDHHLGQLVSRREFPVYCPLRWLVGQDEGKSSISGCHFERRFFENDDWRHEFSTDLVAVLSSDQFAAAQVVHSLREIGLFQGNRIINLPGDIPCSFELFELGERYLPAPSHSLHFWEGSLRCELFRWLRYVTFMATQRGTLAFGFLPQFCNWVPILESLLQDRLRVISIDVPAKETVRCHWIANPEMTQSQLRSVQSVVESRRRLQKEFLANASFQFFSISQDELLYQSSSFSKKLKRFVQSSSKRSVNSTHICGNS